MVLFYHREIILKIKGKVSRLSLGYYGRDVCVKERVS